MKIRNKARGNTTLDDSIVLFASLYCPSNETFNEGYLSFKSGIIFSCILKTISDALPPGSNKLAFI